MIHMLIVFTGNGKGKTTAALGQVMRMLGRGKRALVVQFIKGPWRSGEDEFVTRVKSQGPRAKDADPKLFQELENLYEFDIKKMGKGFVGILDDALPLGEHKRAAREALAYGKEQIANGTWDLVVLDEINVAASLGLLTEDEALDAVKDLPPNRYVIFTGRNASQSFIDRADLATEMREIKHPFNDGTMAKAALEF